MTAIDTGAPRSAPRFHDLGSLLVGHDGRTRPVGGGRLEAALALLLVHAGRRVSPAALCEAMWGAGGVHRSASTLDSHVHRLRKVLEPARRPGQPSAALRRDAGGYRLVASIDQVDSLRFERLVADATGLLAAGAATRALRRTEEALAGWRGRPYGGAADEPWAAPAVARLEELHAQARETLIGALLATGARERALVEVETALAEHPLRERLWAHRMVALRDGGRRADALDTYARARGVLVAELGLEPGPELRALHATLLTGTDTPGGAGVGPALDRAGAGSAGDDAGPGRPMTDRSSAVHHFFKDQEMDFAVRGLLGGAFHRSTDIGEVLSTVARIPDGDAGAWTAQWTATADRLTELARDAEAGDHLRSAAARRLRASSYYSEAADTAPDPAFARLWERHRDAWDTFVDHTAAIGDIVAERITIPYEDTTLPGYFFSRGAGRPARTLVYNNGSDGSVAGSWARAVAPALERGWNVATFDGPGQNAALVRQHLPFRPDWEHVLTPVVDHLLGRPDVDGDRLAVTGISQGGYWVPRAVAFEHRFAAVVADPGVVDVSAAMLSQLPGFLRKLLDRGDRERFDRDMDLAMRFSPDTRRTLHWRMRPYGVDSPFDFFTAARAYVLGPDELSAIRGPILITDPEDESFWPGQPARLAAALTCPVTVVHFTAEEGADGHCEPVGQGLRGERILDWLDEQVPA